MSSQAVGVFDRHGQKMQCFQRLWALRNNLKYNIHAAIFTILTVLFYFEWLRCLDLKIWLFSCYIIIMTGMLIKPIALLLAVHVRAQDKKKD